MLTLARAKKLAAVLLLLCFVLPLSRCTTKVENQGRVTTTETTTVGYTVAMKGWQEVRASEPDGWFTLFAVFNVFFVPAVCLGLKERPQSLIHVLSAPSAGYVLYAWVFVFATSVEAGGWLAVACWVFLFTASSVTLCRHWRK